LAAVLTSAVILFCGCGSDDYTASAPLSEPDIYLITVTDELPVLTDECIVTETHAETCTQSVYETTEAVQMTAETSAQPSAGVFVVINTGSGKYHLNSGCSGVKNMKPENRLDRSFESVDIMVAAGYTPCGICSKEITASDTADTDTEVTVDINRNAVLNVNTKKIHTDVNCSSAVKIKEKNRRDVELDDELAAELIADGYSYCKVCS